MVQPGFRSLDTPRTNIGDATYLNREPDFDITQEPSFVSPKKNGNNLLNHLRNGRSNGVDLRTPRDRAPFNNRRNLPQSIGGAEFTPMLKSATRNSVRRMGKENNGIPATPAFDSMDADLTPMPAGEASMFGRSSYDATMPVIESESTASTPMAIPPRRNTGKNGGPLQDGNQLSLREQENVIDKIEKENFGLKLKIHFLEEALRKAGPGFSEAALKENTELKVDKVTMHRELQRYKKHLTTAEKDLETFRQQMLELQERAKKKHADESLKAEVEKLRRLVDEKEGDIEGLQQELEQSGRDEGRLQKLQDEVTDLEADLREKDRIISEHEDEIEDLKDRLKADTDDKDNLLDERDQEIRELKSKLVEAQADTKAAQRRVIELEEKAQHNEELEDARETIEELERNVRLLEEQADEMKDKMSDAISEKERATNDLEELQEELANKSIATKGLSRQIEEKVTRLQNELDQAGHDYADLEKQFTESFKENEDLRAKMRETKRERDSSDRDLQSLKAKFEDLKADLDAQKDENNILVSRNDALRSEATALQREMSQLRKSATDLEDSLAKERQHALEIEQHIRNQYREEMDKLNDEISDLQAEIRERDNLYDNDSDKWESEKRTLESERDRAEEKAAGLQKTIDKLREAEGNLSSKETKLQEVIQSEAERHKNDEAILKRQIQELQEALETRLGALTDLRNELSAVRDELRQSNLDFQAQTQRVGALQDEVEVLQAELDEGGGTSQEDLRRARRECEVLKQEIETLRRDADLAKSATSASQETAQATSSSLERLRSQLTTSSNQLAALTKEKQTLQDKLATTNIDLHMLRSSLAEVKAERDELHSELKRSQRYGEETYRLDQEKVDLRTAKMKLDNEVRRLKDESKLLSEQRRAVEKSLEEEILRAAEEEDRLNEEIRQLQAQIRQTSSSESQDMAAARRAIRDLERRVEEYQLQLAEAGANYPGFNAGEGNSELSMIRRDLTAARAKEMDYLQKESAHKEAVRGLKRQIADLERRAHEAELSRLIDSPGSSSTVAGHSVRKSEVTELRHQLTAAHQAAQDLRAKLRETERKASAASQDLQARLDDVEDERLALEQALDDARRETETSAAQHEKVLARLRLRLEKAERDAKAAQSSSRNLNAHSDELLELQARLDDLEEEKLGLEKALEEARRQADEASAQHEKKLRKMKHKLERAEREAAKVSASRSGADKELREMLRTAQIETDALEHDARRQQGAIEALVTAEAGVRRKLERARSERAAYRASAEKLQRDVKELRALGGDARLSGDKAVVASGDSGRHEKEIRGLVMQMEWMQKRWEREAGLRADAAYAKRFIQLQLEVANACNKAQLRELESIRTELLGSRREVPPTSRQLKQLQQQQQKQTQGTGNGKPTLRTALLAARFIARMRIQARKWAAQEETRRRIVACVDDMKRQKRARLQVVRAS